MKAFVLVLAFIAIAGPVHALSIDFVSNPMGSIFNLISIPSGPILITGQHFQAQVNIIANQPALVFQKNEPVQINAQISQPSIQERNTFFSNGMALATNFRPNIAPSGRLHFSIHAPLRVLPEGTFTGFELPLRDMNRDFDP